mmetsp:Transcript_24873/g.63010  ORF Transcript_24873/g.63010 Transcript_24873/m.63010 type:complete len:163 (-) Transcript_24873:107-595(-)
MATLARSPPLDPLTPLTPAEAQAKVREYEAFVAQRLQPDLRTALEALDVANAELADFLALRAQLEQIEALQLEPLRLQVNLGADFFAQAQVDDPSKVCVHVGLGFFAELTRAEALSFIEGKARTLELRAATLGEQASTIRAHIQVLLEAVAELSNSRLTATR